LQTEGVVLPDAQPHLIQTTTQKQLQLSPFSITIPNLTPHSINHGEPQGIKQGEELKNAAANKAKAAAVAAAAADATAVAAAASAAAATATDAASHAASPSLEEAQTQGTTAAASTSAASSIAAIASTSATSTIATIHASTTTTTATTATMDGEVGDANPVDDESAEEDHGDGEVGDADPVHEESAEEHHHIVSNSYNWIIKGVDGLDEQNIRHMNAFYALLKKWLRKKEYASKLLTKEDYDARVNFIVCVKEGVIELCSSCCHRNNNKCKNKHDDNVDSGK
jgi:hypothetical protein